MKRLGRVVAGAAVLCAARALPAQDITCQRGDIEVRALEFSGNSAYGDAILESGIMTTPSSWWRRTFRILGKRYCLDSLAVRADSLRLVYFYRAHGFGDAKVAYRISAAGVRAVRVHYTISEGRPLLLDSLGIAGLDSVPDKARIAGDLPIRVGSRFDQFIVDQVRDTLVRRLRDRGYPLADVLRDFSTDTAAHRADVTYTAYPGPRQYLGNISIRVLTSEDSTNKARIAHLHADRIHSVLGIREGQLYRETSLEGVKRGLYATEAFRHVDVSIDSTSLKDAKPDSITVAVTLIETKLSAARLSFGWGNLDCGRWQGSYSNYAFLGRLRRLDLSARLSKIGVGSPLDFAPNLCTGQVRHDPLSDTVNYYFGATVSQAALFRLPFIPSATLYSERRSEFQAFLRDTPIGMVGSLQQGVDGRFPRSYSYQLEYGRTLAQPAFFCAVFNVCEEAARERLERFERTAVLGWVGTRVDANGVANPNRGTVSRLELRHASRIVGSSPDVEFNRGVFDISYYAPALGGALAVRLRAGAVVGRRLSFSGSPTFIPIQERLYAGGPTTVRGFRQNELGPAIYIPRGQNSIDTVAIPGEDDTLKYLRAVPTRSGQQVVPTGGDNLVVGNIELRLRSVFLPELVQYALFVDAGQVWNRGRSGTGINFRDIRVTPGVGARIFSPIGPVRMDVGYNPYAQPSGPAYYNPLLQGGFANSGDVGLICVSPQNTLRVFVSGIPGDIPRQVDKGDCPATYAPAKGKAFFRRLTISFSIGQPF